MFKFLLIAMGFYQLSAMSIGRDGNHINIDNTNWQPVKYEDDEAGFKAILPGEPISGFKNQLIFSCSKFNKSYYQISTPLKNFYTPPQTEDEFLNFIAQTNPDGLQFHLIPNMKDKIIYVVEALFPDNVIARFYCSANKIYQMIVEGEDNTLAQVFFDSMQITY